nr:hypothetical protein Iba_chr07aCG14860 [Ipomoea batatas]
MRADRMGRRCGGREVAMKLLEWDVIEEWWYPVEIWCNGPVWSFTCIEIVCLEFFKEKGVAVLVRSRLNVARQLLARENGQMVPSKGPYATLSRGYSKSEYWRGLCLWHFVSVDEQPSNYSPERRSTRRLQKALDKSLPQRPGATWCMGESSIVCGEAEASWKIGEEHNGQPAEGHTRRRVSKYEDIPILHPVQPHVRDILYRHSCREGSVNRLLTPNPAG